MAPGLPRSGSVFCSGLRAINNHVKKEIRESGRRLDLAALLTGAGVAALRDGNAGDGGGGGGGGGGGSSSGEPSLKQTLAELEVRYHYNATQPISLVCI